MSRQKKTAGAAKRTIRQLCCFGKASDDLGNHTIDVDLFRKRFVECGAERDCWSGIVGVVCLAGSKVIPTDNRHRPCCRIENCRDLRIERPCGADVLKMQDDGRTVFYKIKTALETTQVQSPFLSPIADCVMLVVWTIFPDIL